MRTYINCQALLPIIVITIIIILYISKTVCLWLNPLAVLKSAVKVNDDELIDHPEYGW